MSNEVAKKKSQEVTKGVDVKSMMFDNNVGHENTTAESYTIPIMKIVADLSPVYKKDQPQYNPDADLGDFYNSATGELLKEINCRVLSIDHKLFVWKENRGGLVGIYDKHEESAIVTKRDGLKKWDKDGNTVMDTLQYTLCFADNLTLEGVFFMGFASTSFKYGKAWNSKIKAVRFDTKTFQPNKDGQTAASWVGEWNIKTVKDHKGENSWFTVGNTPKLVRGITEKEIGQLGKLLQEVGNAEVDYASMQDDHGTTSETVNSETDAF